MTAAAASSTATSSTPAGKSPTAAVAPPAVAPPAVAPTTVTPPGVTPPAMAPPTVGKIVMAVTKAAGAVAATPAIEADKSVIIIRVGPSIVIWVAVVAVSVGIAVEGV